MNFLFHSAECGPQVVCVGNSQLDFLKPFSSHPLPHKTGRRDIDYNAVRGSAGLHRPPCGGSSHFVFAVLAFHAPGSWPAPGPWSCPAPSGPPAPDGERPSDPLPAVETSVRGRVQPVYGQPFGGCVLWLPGHEGGLRQDGRCLLPQTTHVHHRQDQQ